MFHCSQVITNTNSLVKITHDEINLHQKKFKKKLLLIFRSFHLSKIHLFFHCKITISDNLSTCRAHWEQNNQNDVIYLITFTSYICTFSTDQINLTKPKFYFLGYSGFTPGLLEWTQI